MTDRERQEIFAKNEMLLRQKVYELGYTVTLGEAWRPESQAWIYSLPSDSSLVATAPDGRTFAFFYPVGGLGSLKSLHRKRLAIDYNLMKDGSWMTKKEHYEKLGEYWCSLHEDNRWGGNYGGDIFHFSMTDGITKW